MNTSAISEVEMEHCDAGASALVTRVLSAKDSTRDHCSEMMSDGNLNRISLECRDQNGVVGSLKDRRNGKKQRVFRNEGEISAAGSLPWNDSDDDFRESMYDIPLARRIRSTCEDSLFSKSGRNVSRNIQPVEMSSKVSAQNGFSSEQADAELPCTSRSQSSQDLNSRLVDNDEFDVHGLIDSFLDDRRATKHDQNELHCGETSLHNACKKKKFPEADRGSSKEYPNPTLSSSIFDTFLSEHTLNAGTFDNEVEADSNPDGIAGILDDPVVNIYSSSEARHSNKSGDTNMAMSCGNVDETIAEDMPSQHRYRRKRLINYDECFDKTFDILDKQTENVSHSHRSQLSTMGSSTDTTEADGLACSKTLADLKPHKGKPKKSSYVAAVQSDSLSNARENSEVDVGGVSMTGRDTECKRKYRFKKISGTDRNHSATVGDALAEYARPESVVASKKKKKSKLCPSSSVGSSSSSNNDIDETVVSRSLAHSSTASSLFCHAGRNDTVSRFRPHAVVDSSREDLAIHDRVNARDTSTSRHMVRNTGSQSKTESRDVADDRTQNAAVNNDSYSASLKVRLKNMKRRLTNYGRILYDSDDDDDDDYRASSRNTSGNSTAENAAVSVSNAGDSRSLQHSVHNILSRSRRIIHDSDDDEDDNRTEFPVSNRGGTSSYAEHGSELAVHDVSSGNDVIVIGSDDEPSADVETINEQTLSDGLLRSATDDYTTAAQLQHTENFHEENLLRPRRRRVSRTARMSCG